jgi:pSer/pThr/pTyr-binding forkhead associated (FHA) protein
MRTPAMKEKKPSAGTTNKKADKAEPFRPKQRPPMALVCIVDDGRDTGEWVRMRASRLIIGRSEGDILIPHDEGISGRHIELSRTISGGQARWHLRDLKSTNGTFVRVKTAILNDNQQILVGSRRLRFNFADGPADATPAHAPTRNATQGWQVLTREKVEAGRATVVELTPNGEGVRTPLTASEYWIGSDPSRSGIVLADDPFVTAQHTRLHEDSQGRWHIEDGGSLNGTWLQLGELAIDTHAEFLAGEQRFLIRVLGHEDPAAG